MAAVVNFLKFKDHVDVGLFERAERELVPRLGEIDGFEGFKVIQVADDEVALLIFADTTTTLDQIATDVGSPWMIANVLPLLDGPPQRRIGPVIASS